MNAQQAGALELANRMRRDRRALRLDMRAREVGLIEALDRPEAQGLQVEKLLIGLPRIQKKAAAKILRRAGGIDPTTRVEVLGSRRRAAILAVVERDYPASFKINGEGEAP